MRSSDAFSSLSPMAAAFLALQLPALAAAYSWNFGSNPTQCGDLTFQITGDDGQPPYRVLMIPYGATPFGNGTEVRRVFETDFDGNSNSLTFQLKYPADSQFVAVMSDSSSFGSGGTSVSVRVLPSDDSSCFDASKNTDPPSFYYNIFPRDTIVQCQDTRIWWNEGAPQGNPVFLGAIPGGDSFEIPQGRLTQESGQGTGFTWTPNLRGMTQMLMVGGDARGNGSAGSTLYTIGNGDTNNSCLSDNSPSSTAGSPAGGSYQTGTDGGSVGGSNGGGGGGGGSGGGSNIGAIVGGVVGGVVGLVALLLLAWFLRRKSKNNRRGPEKHVDLLNEDEGDERPGRQELPQYYEPEPFLVPDPTVESSSISGDGRYYAPTASGRSGTPDLHTPTASSFAGGKRAPRQLRPVNIIQHDDAGPSGSGPPPEEEPETIELPPAYTRIRQNSNASAPAPPADAPPAAAPVEQTAH